MILVERISDDSCRSVLAVSCTECVHYIYVSVRSQLSSELLLALLHLSLSSIKFWSTLLNANWLSFLFWIEAEVLEQESLTWLQGSCFSISVTAVLSELNVYAESV